MTSSWRPIRRQNIAYKVLTSAQISEIFQNSTHFLKSSEKMRSNEWSPILNGQAAEKLCQFEYKQK